ncbi:histidinol-phosphatase HisJ family protein [Oscillibacter sp. PEA192]|uniref:histidinol-phosphatase HisJ family protein n=1 Tax=Oscillibacter sp. PEA192 TaxID=2109687 RepID=UPI000E6566BE
MYLADYHVHSRISPDASASMQEMAEAAIRLGFQEICFTDHVEPIRFGTTEPRGAYDWDPMIAEFRAARTAVGDRITLRLGAELGDAVWGIRRMESMLAEAPPLDFLIGSIHTLSEKMEGRDLYFLTPRDEQEARDCLADYLGQVRKLAEWGRFQVLGHLTLPLRYLNENRGMHVSFDGFEEEIAEIFRLIIPKGIGIELNTNRGNTPLPDEKWLQLYRSLGGEIVTLGTDAHTPGFVGCAVREGQALLRACGFRRFAAFRQGKPVWHEL